ncbi:MAG: hypothetical protein JSR67_07740 [Proteobacteria bacterium]|nr:hypothetical protein [Pseudomonadota bacterium]
MKYRVVILSAVLSLGLAASAAHAAESQAVRTMAGILLHLQHFATDTDKQSLKQIVQDSSATPDEHTVAEALMDVKHTVPAADRPKLAAIVKDDKASAGVKTLASVLLELKHVPSAGDKEKLEPLAK